MHAFESLLDELEAGQAEDFGGDLLGWTQAFQSSHRHGALVQHVSKTILGPETLVGTGGKAAARLAYNVGRAAVEGNWRRQADYRNSFLVGMNSGQDVFVGLVEQLSAPFGVEDAIEQATNHFADNPELADTIVNALRNNAEVVLPKPSASIGEIEICTEFLPSRHSFYEHPVIRGAAICVADLNRLTPTQIRTSIGMKTRSQPLVVFALNMDTAPIQVHSVLGAEPTYFASLDQGMGPMIPGPFGRSGVFKISDDVNVMVNPSTLGLVVNSEKDVLPAWMQNGRPARCLVLPVDADSREWPNVDRFFRRMSVALEHGVLGQEQYRSACNALSDTAAAGAGAVGVGQRALLHGLIALNQDPELEIMPVAAVKVVVDGVCNLISSVVGNQIRGHDLIVSPKLFVGSVGQEDKHREADDDRGNGGGGSGSGGDGRGSGRNVERRLDVLVKGTGFGIGDNIVVLAVLKLLSKPKTGQQNVPAILPHGHDDVLLVLDCHGFRLEGPNEVRRTVPLDEDSEPAAFLLWIEAETERWIQVKLYQNGTPVTAAYFTHEQLTRISRQQTRLVTSNIDVTLDFDTKDSSVKLSSPHWMYSANRKDLGIFGIPKRARMDKLRDHLREIQKNADRAIDIEEELKDIGHLLSKCLPEDLIAKLTDEPPRLIFLNHDRNFDFPFELVLLDRNEGERLLGDVIPVCRWVTGSKFPTADLLAIDRAALLMGDTTAADDDFLLLKALTDDASEFTEPEDVYKSVFASTDFNLVHFTGHIPNDGDGYARLMLKHGELSAVRIGRKQYQAFAKRRPLITLNGCASGTPHLSFFGEVSFPKSFIDANATALIGTLWPVHETVAHEFSKLFYRTLDGSTPIFEAMHKAKRALCTVFEDENGNALTPQARCLRSVSARSYCLYAHPSTIVSFSKSA